MDAEVKPDYEPAKLFNDAQKEFSLRLSTFTNHLLVLNAGILSITIGAFLGIKPPSFVPDALGTLRVAWWLLTISLVCALTSSFCVLLGQTMVQDQLRVHYQSAASGPLKLFAGPGWLRSLIRSLVVLSFVTCVTGILAMSAAASQMLRLP
ncbi:MAG: hypothetical protein WA159_02000 [Variovorax sp.]